MWKRKSDNMPRNNGIRKLTKFQVWKQSFPLEYMYLLPICNKREVTFEVGIQQENLRSVGYTHEDSCKCEMFSRVRSISLPGELLNA